MPFYFDRLDKHLLTLMHVYSALNIRENGAVKYEDRADELSRLIPLTLTSIEAKYSDSERDPQLAEAFEKLASASKGLTDLEYRLLALFNGQTITRWLQAVATTSTYFDKPGKSAGRAQEKIVEAIRRRHIYLGKGLLDEYLLTRDRSLLEPILSTLQIMPAYSNFSAVTQLRNELDEMIESIWIQAVIEGV